MLPNWKWDYAKSSPVLKLLDDPEATLESIVEEETAAVEFRNFNKRITGRFKTCDYYQMVSWMCLTTKVPDEKRASKLATISSDILSCDVPEISHVFFPPTPHTEQEIVYQEVQTTYQAQQETCPTQTPSPPQQETEGQVLTKKMTLSKVVQKEKQPLLHYMLSSLAYADTNQTVVGFVCKVINNLLIKNGKPFCKTFFSYQKQFRLNFLRWLSSRSVVEFIIKMICLQEAFVDNQNNYIEQRIELLQEVCNKILHQSDNEVIVSASLILSETFNRCLLNASGPLISEVAKLLQYISNQTFQQVFNAITNNVQKQGGWSFMLQIVKNLKKESLVPANILNRFLQFVNQTLFSKCERFGMFRMRVLECLGCLVRIMPQLCYEYMIQNETVYKLLKLSEAFQFNNIMQNQIVKIINTLSEQEQHNWLFQKEAVFKFLREINIEPLVVKAAKFTRGYTGLLIRLTEILQKSNSFQQQINNCKELQVIKQKFVVPCQNKNDFKLGGYSKRDLSIPQNIYLSKSDVLLQLGQFLRAPFKFQEEVEIVAGTVEDETYQAEYSSIKFWKMEFSPTNIEDLIIDL